MVKVIYDENNLEETKIIDDYYRFKYLIKDFSDTYMKFLSKYDYDLLTEDEERVLAENAIKHNIWSFSKNDIDFVFDTIRMIYENDFFTNADLLLYLDLSHMINLVIIRSESSLKTDLFERAVQKLCVSTFRLFYVMKKMKFLQFHAKFRDQ